MISIMTTCFNSVKHKLSPTNGFFDLLGFDFMLDEALNVSPHLTHVQCMHTVNILVLTVQACLRFG